MKTGFTDAQTETLNAAARLLAEHFDFSLIAVSAETVYKDQSLAETTDLRYHGSRIAAIGLTEEARYRLIHGAYEVTSRGDPSEGSAGGTGNPL
jgi:hypothetical protein